MDAHKNFARSTVATAPSPATSGTSLVVASGDGALFPAVAFNATVWPAGAQPTNANAEIVRVTVIATDTFTITRTQESTSARTIVVGDQIAATVTNKTLTDIEAAALGGDVVGPASSVASEAVLFDGTTGKLVTRATGTGVVHRTSGVDSVSAVVEADQTLADNTTRDVSTSMHGYAPKAPNNTGQFLRADAAYAYPKERVSAIASSATPTPNADTDDLYDVTALAAAAAFGAPTGTPRNGQKLIIRIKDNATARALTWDAAYVAHGVALPTTTVLSKVLRVGFEYDTANGLNKWCCIASAQEA